MSEVDTKFQSILDSAFKLFNEHGVRNVSMDDISRQMGISKKTLYKYVENKADLLHKISESIFNKVSATICELEKSNLNAIDILLEMSKIPGNLFKRVNPIINFEMRKYYPRIFDESNSNRKVLITKSVRKNLEQGIKEGLYRQDLDKEIVAHLYYKKIEDFHNLDVDNLKFCTFDKIFEVMFENHIRGIANVEGIAYFEKQKEKLNFNIQ